MKEIPITSFDNLQIGQAENTAAGTGCTVVLLGKDGAPAGLDVRGGGPASRESELLKPLAAAQVIHAIVLAGGSAFGLDAAGGVMRYLEERGIGFDVGVTKVPLVCQSDLFDLTVADARTRPDAAMAYAACVNAETGNYRDGNHGAGTGATVGKLLGMDHCMKSGIGSYAVLFKDEVRQAGRELGLPEYLVARQPFPGPGLAIRIIGDVTPEKVAIVQDADAIWREEIDKLPMAQRPSQYFAALTNMRSVGVMGDERTYDYAIALRAVTTTDFMTAEVTILPTETITTAANRIVNEVKNINRVMFDYTTKPPATIEFE